MYLYVCVRACMDKRVHAATCMDTKHDWMYASLPNVSVNGGYNTVMATAVPSLVSKSTYPGHGSLQPPVVSAIQVGEDAIFILQRAKLSLQQ